jgi:pimeloyl-ACP methyl ester carboxylesterase
MTGTSRQTGSYEERWFSALGDQVSVYTGGEGAPLIVLHRDTGRLGWTDFHDALAQKFTVYAPAMPGYDNSDRPEWMRTVGQLAVSVGFLVDALDLGPCPLVGLGFGGWVATEAAVMCPQRYSSLIVQSPMGVKPSEGEYLDQFLYPAFDYVKLGFADKARFATLFGVGMNDEDARRLDGNREMTTRIGWKPYMYSQALTHQLPYMQVPTLVVSSGADVITPVSAVEEFSKLLPISETVHLESAGHYADLEVPDILAKLIFDYLAVDAHDGN